MNCLFTWLRKAFEYLDELLVGQNFKCAMSGVSIFTGKSSKYCNVRAVTASVDRIDSMLGYTEGNIQWVHKDINRLKSDFDTGKFIDLCISVSEYAGKKMT